LTIAQPDEHLDRALGPWSVGANAVNLSLGAGIFALPAAVAAILGPAAILAYLVCGVAIALVLTCFAEIGSQTMRSGGAIAYIEEAFGPLAGFLAWVIFSPGFCLASDAAVANVLIGAVAIVVPSLGHGLARAVALVAVFTALAAVNIVGVRQGARVAVATTVAKLLPLLLVIGAGALAMHWQEMRWTEWPSSAKVGEASLLLFFAYTGAESAVTPGGEIRDPARTIPRGLLGGTAVLIVLYAAVQVTTQGVLGPGITQHGDAPLAAAAYQVLGAAGQSLVVACTALAGLGLLTGDMLASPRTFLPVAESGMLPAALAAVHPRFRTPYVAIAVYGATCCVLAISGAFAPLAILASISLLIVYFAVCLAALKLRIKRDRPAGAFRAPGGPLVPLLGALVVAWLLSHTSAAEARGMALALAVAAAYYAIRRGVIRRSRTMSL
jgi:APA family basic amino acid/polyamine antiporter